MAILDNGVSRMRVYKNRQYLVFDFEDGKTVKYDFATKTAIGFKGRPVKDLKTQLRGMTINDLIKCCQDKNYANFLIFVKNKCGNISNIGTILSMVPRYKNYEQIFSAGLNYMTSYNFTLSINDIPKSLIKALRNSSIKVSNRHCKYWAENPDAHYIGYTLNYNSLDEVDLANIWRSESSSYNVDRHEYIYTSYFNKLVSEYGYSPKSLFLYMDYLKTYEAIEDISCAMRELFDYARMMNSISPKYDKYPKHFLTTHKIACRNYNRLKKEFPEKLFQKQIRTDYECSYKDYVFIYPKTTQDIKNEAVSQNNCVASYIDNVIDGKCHIMFLRKKDNPDKSLVTLEIVDNEVVQAARRFNYGISDEEKNAIAFWNRKYSKKESRIA